MRDDFFDIIFIDGDHRYAGAYSNIANAIHKIKPGGLLMGHDCNGYADNLPSEILLANLDKDCAFFQGKQYSCGVLKALKDCFGIITIHWLAVQSGIRSLLRKIKQSILVAYLFKLRKFFIPVNRRL